MNTILMTHCLDPKRLRQDDFEGFLASRQRILLTKIETAMSKQIIVLDPVVSEDVVEGKNS